MMSILNDDCNINFLLHFNQMMFSRFSWYLDLKDHLKINTKGRFEKHYDDQNINGQNIQFQYTFKNNLRIWVLYKEMRPILNSYFDVSCQTLSA